MNLLEQETHPHCPNCLIAYAAGYFDGEAHIGMLPMGRGNLALRITIVSGDSEAQQAVSAALGGRSYQIKSRTEKPLFRWALSGSKAREALRVMFPFLLAKRAQAKLVLDCEYADMRRGNTKGMRPEDYATREHLRKSLTDEKHK